MQSFLSKKPRNINAILMIDFCAFFFILIMCILATRNKYIPGIINDEYGYWMSAAFFSGRDWSSIAQRVFYYSYGYGFILAPLFLLTKSYIVLYRLAILLNSIWLFGSYFCLNKLMDNIYNQETIAHRIISLTATVYCSNICMLNYSTPEVFLFFLFCLSSYLLFVAIKNNRPLYYMILPLISVMAYSVHQRMVAIILCETITIIVLAIYKEIPIDRIIVYCFSLILVFAIAYMIKAAVISNVWSNSTEITSGNDYSGQLEKITGIITGGLTYNFIFGLIGKIYYYSFSTLGLGLLFFQITNRKEKMTSTFCIKLFLTMTILVGIVISAIFLIHPDHTTHIYYGRYIDCYLGPIIALTICELKSLTKRQWIISMLWALLLTIIVSFFQSNSTFTTANYSINDVGMLFAYKDGINVFALPILSFVIMMLCYLCRNRKVNAAVICFMVIWIITGIKSYFVFRNRYYDELVLSTNTVLDIINRMETTIGEEVSFCTVDNADEIFSAAPQIQYVFMDRSIPYSSSLFPSDDTLFFGVGNISVPDSMLKYDIDGLYSIYCTTNYIFRNQLEYIMSYEIP